MAPIGFGKKRRQRFECGFVRRLPPSRTPIERYEICFSLPELIENNAVKYEVKIYMIRKKQETLKHENIIGCYCTEDIIHAQNRVHHMKISK